MPIASNNPEVLPSVCVQEEELVTVTHYVRDAETIVYPPDASTEDQMSVVEASGTLDFWGDEEEDRYDESDGDAA